MDKVKVVYMYIREHFRKHKKTNWGKHQIITELDKLEKEMMNE